MELNLNIKPLYLGIILVTVFTLLLTFIILMLPRQAKDEMPQQAVMPDVPEADTDVLQDGSKTGSYSRSVSEHWNSLEEEAAAAESQNTGSAPPGAGAADINVKNLFAEDKAPGQSTPPAKRKSVPAKAHPSEEKTPEVKTESPVLRTGSVSCLDDCTSDLGNGVSSLDGPDSRVVHNEDKPILCMFMRDEKIRSGQRITLRILEDTVIESVHIPANTHLQGVCRISERMEISVRSLDMGGRILHLDLEALDTDGSRGIYCSELRGSGREAVNQGVSTASSLLGGKLGRIASDAVSLGASLIRSKTGEITVSVPAGYTFYLARRQE